MKSTKFNSRTSLFLMKKTRNLQEVGHKNVDQTFEI